MSRAHQKVMLKHNAGSAAAPGLQQAGKAVAGMLPP
jgi:hypothetical protein